MPDFSKISYLDLRLEVLSGRLPKPFGRKEEVSRLNRVLSRRMHNNALVVGASGIGKTSLVYAWVQNLSASSQSELPIVELKAESFDSLSNPAAPVSRFKEALESLPECALFIDDFGQIIFNKPVVLAFVTQLLKPLAESGKIRLILALETKEFTWLKTQQPNFLNYFEEIPIETLPKEEIKNILIQYLKNSSAPSLEGAATKNIETIINLSERFPTLGQLPASGLRLLDESLSLARTENLAQISEAHIFKVASEKTGVPLNQLKVSDKELLKNLEKELGAKIIGQSEALMQITSAIKRARLGLKNPGRPLASFLCLGPSGVGKTETAKLVSEKIFGKKESFIRIDMSEFSEAHTVARLIGSPAGYVGFEAGGGLTNAVKAQPYSLVLLDEIEKAHPKIFDIFLQMLDDGRLTSGQGETVDFTQTIIMATSNLGVEEIIGSFQAGVNIHDESFLQQTLTPKLSKAFRLEFLNRFDAILVFNPLSEANLLEVAKLEIKKVESRVAHHNIKFKIDPEILKHKIKTLSDPRFGARPVKRFVETVCENLIAEKLLS
jgi:ATP-dependent Clp protease ATP-binding subunit ClpC